MPTGLTASVWLNAGWAEAWWRKLHLSPSLALGTERLCSCEDSPNGGAHSCCARVWAVLGRTLAVCLHHEAFGVNDGEPGQTILTVAMPKPPTFHIGVILACTKLCMSLSFPSFCSEAFLKPRPGGLIPWTGRTRQRERLLFPNWRKSCVVVTQVEPITCRNWASWR